MLAFCFIRLRGNGDCEPISDLSPSFARARTSPEHDPFLRPIASGVNPSRCLNSRCLTKTISLDSQRALIRDATEYRVRWRNQNRSIWDTLWHLGPKARVVRGPHRSTWP